MTRITVATFNCENMFRRFKFKGKLVEHEGKKEYEPWSKEELDQIASDGFEIDLLKFADLSGDSRRITADAVKATDADVIALQEVENMEVLKVFNSRYLASKFRYKLLIDSNDPRYIDVAVLSRFPLAGIRTNQYRRTPDNKAFVFSRDCLEVAVQINSEKCLRLFVNHFKSMVGGRDSTMDKRKQQSKEVAKILKQRFGGNPGEQEWIVIGDLNDFLPSAGLSPLLDKPWLENVIQTRIEDPEDRWTHFWAGGNQYSQLDYILLSRALAEKNPDAVPAIERRGTPLRASRYAGERFEGVGQDGPKASDHCPVSIKLQL